jgi:hypothetical protein
MVLFENPYGGTFFIFFLALMGVLGILVWSMMSMKRLWPRSQEGSSFFIQEHHPLTAKHSIFVVFWEGKKILLSTSPENVKILLETSPDSEPYDRKATPLLRPSSPPSKGWM